MGDALVKSVYLCEKLHWDVVLRFDTSDTHHDRIRKGFEYALLKEGLFLERESAIDGRKDAFLKVLCPFDKLVTEAQAAKLQLPVRSGRFSELKKAVFSIRKRLDCIFDRWKSIDQAPYQLSAKFKRKKLHHFTGVTESGEVQAIKSLFTNAQRNLLVCFLGQLRLIDISHSDARPG